MDRFFKVSNKYNHITCKWPRLLVIDILKQRPRTSIIFSKNTFFDRCKRLLWIVKVINMVIIIVIKSSTKLLSNSFIYWSIYDTEEYGTIAGVI